MLLISIILKAKRKNNNKLTELSFSDSNADSDKGLTAKTKIIPINTTKWQRLITIE